MLCQLLWEEKKIPTAKKVKIAWHNHVINQKHLITHDLTELSLNQRKVITAIAKSSSKEIQSTEFTAPLKISPSSAQQSLDVLMRKDLVYRNTDGYCFVLDPAIKYYLDTVLSDDLAPDV